MINRILKVLCLCICCSWAFNVHSENNHEWNQISLLGDSMTWIGGDSCQNNTGWTYYLKRSGLTDKIDVYARSGATWTNTVTTKCDTAFYSELLHDDNVIINQALRLCGRVKSGSAEIPDLIVIYAGANDAWFSNRRPDIFDISKTACTSLPTSLSGSVEYVCKLLKRSFPDTNILLVTPLEMTKTDVETIARVSNIIEATANKCGVSVYRADKNVPIRRTDELKQLHYTKDGVHTNPEGARLLADYLIEAIRQNLEARR